MKEPCAGLFPRHWLRDFRVIAYLSWTAVTPASWGCQEHVGLKQKADQGGLLRPFCGRNCQLSPVSILHLFLSALLLCCPRGTQNKDSPPSLSCSSAWPHD